MSSAVIPSPSTYAAGPVLAPQLRGDAADAVAWLSRRPMFIGTQTNSAQAVPNNTDTPVALDTEVYDNYGGHQIVANTARYYGMQPGWYLAEAICPLNYTGGGGQLSVGVGGNQAGGTFGVFYGSSIQNSSGLNPSGIGARLLQMVSTGHYGAASNDYISLYVRQNSTASQNLLNGTSRLPQLYARWICSNTGTAVSEPSPAAWPVPPSFVTSAFLNAQIRDTIRFLAYPPVMEWSATSTGQNLASQTTVPAVGTTIDLDTSTVDNYSAFSNSTNTWTAPVAGLYYAYGQVSTTGSPSSVAAAAGLTVTSANYNSGTKTTLWGGSWAGSTTGNNSVIVRRRLRLAAGDAVQLAGFQRDSGSSTAPVLGTGTWTSKLIMVWEAA